MNNNLAIYGAVLSTIVFFWKIYDEWKNRKGKILIELTTSTQFIVMGNIASDNEKMLVAKFTNIGRSDRLIERPKFETNRKEKDRFMEVIDLNSKIIYPFELKSGQTHIQRFPINNLEIENKNFKKIRSIVNDTFKKRYKSKWIEIDSLLN